MEVSDSQSHLLRSDQNIPNKTVPWHHPTRPAYRFTVMFFACAMCTGVYMSYDSIGAISPYLKDGMEIDNAEYSKLQAIYALPNVLLAFLGGSITDKIGYNKASVIFSVFVVIGNSVMAYSQEFNFVLAGRFIFGLGGESLIVSQTTMLTHWFAGHELGLAFGLSLSMGMLGSTFAYWLLPIVADASSVSTALWLNAGFCVLSFLMDGVFIFLDLYAKRVVEAEKRQEAENRGSTSPENPFGHTEIAIRKHKPSVWDVKELSVSYWILIVVILAFYGAINFSYNCTDTMYTKYEYSEHEAAQITSMIYFIGAFLSPVVGWYVDMWGFRMQLMTFGIALLIPSFGVLAYTTWDPIAPVVLLGLSYAIVPAVCWTIIPLIVPEYLAGKAFGISYSLYDGTLFAIPLLYGHMHEITNDGYMWGITLYFILSIIALVACVPLWIIDNSTGELVMQKPAPGEKVKLPCMFLNNNREYVKVDKR